MKTVTVKEVRSPVKELPPVKKVRKVKKETRVSTAREWKLLYSPLAQKIRPRAGPVRDLCWNCGQREECTRPRPEGGVWCCNEYIWEER